MEQGAIEMKEVWCMYHGFTPDGFYNNGTEEVETMLVFNTGQEREDFLWAV